MVDLKRAKSLLKSAEGLYQQRDFAGVSGLAYQAFEAGIIALSQVLQEDSVNHLSRRKRAEELLGVSAEVMKKLWRARNVDFYGNETPNGRNRELSEAEIKEALNTVTNLLIKIEELIQEWT